MAEGADWPQADVPGGLPVPMPEARKDLDSLCRQLQAGVAAARLRAAQELGAHGPEAVAPLCAALRDADPEVCHQAARSLGQIGDARAVPALLAALRDRFAGRSGWLNLGLGLARAGGTVYATLALTLAGCALCGILTTWLFHQPVLGTIIWLFVAGGTVPDSRRRFLERQRENRLCAAISEALSQIAERQPTAELREALPDLKTVALDLVQQQKETRIVARAAAERIDALTHNLRSLPLAGEAPAADPSGLPRASAPSAEY